MALITLDQVSIAFGSLPLLDRIGLQIEAGERVCLIGRNGSGKSTLLQIINGDQAPDSGSVWRQPGVQTARLVQDAALFAERPVFDVVAEGLGDLSDLVTSYHHTAVEVAEHATPALLEKLGNSAARARRAGRMAARAARRTYFVAVEPPDGSYRGHSVRAVGAAASCLPAPLSRSPRFSCSTSPPITSISRQSPGSKLFLRIIREPFCSSRMIGLFSGGSLRESSSSIAGP